MTIEYDEGWPIPTATEQQTIKLRCLELALSPSNRTKFDAKVIVEDAKIMYDFVVSKASSP